MDERFPLVDAYGNVTGSALRSECHGNPELMHPVVHCIVLDDAGRFLLQLRSRHKDVQPGRWDTSVGGHVGFGESIEAALAREMREELGIEPAAPGPRFLYRYVHTNEVETELVHTYVCESHGPFVADPNEIDELRFWSRDDIRAALGRGVFTPNFEQEFARYLAIEDASSPRP